MQVEQQYGRLSQAPVSPEGCHLLEAFNPPPVAMNSPAVDVMTDLAKIPAATIGAEASLEEANRSMLARGVRLLVVADDDGRITGLVTTVDIHGEKAMRVAQARQAAHAELRVTEVMVPVEKVEALSFDAVRKATVGNIVATLTAAGRAHALVLDRTHSGRQVLRGIFSVTQIARQLGQPIHTYEVAHTFAEIEAVLASA